MEIIQITALLRSARILGKVLQICQDLLSFILQGKTKKQKQREPTDHRVKIKENEKRDKYLDLARELKKKSMEHESDSDTNCSWCTWNNPRRSGKKKSGRVGNYGTGGDHLHYNIIEKSQSTEK